MTNLRTYHWKDGKKIVLGKKTLVMRILNVTPDSFSDGGQWNTLDQALFHAEEMVREGADLIDVGAESSRPGFVPMPAEAEWERLEPFLTRLIQEIPVPLSVDTFKAKTAERAMALGAHMINDIWGLQYGAEPEGAMAKAAAKYQVPVIAMHNQAGTQYAQDILREMQRFFQKTVQIAKAAGIEESKLIFDPGIGFGKTAEQNMQVIKRLHEAHILWGQKTPLLLGTSRKSFIGAALNLPVDERMEATGTTCIWGSLQGCDIVRVHDVKPIVRMCRMLDAIREA